uniref:SCP domain-containing protein n=1 Tax=Strongyloides venezuelensis TaxID=75913 RepID=A0A0K0FJB6_STRVS
MLYECNNFFFNRHADVVDYYNKLTSGKIKRKNKRPNRALFCRSISLKNPLLKIAEYSYPDLLKSNPFSERIWKRVWGYCDYSCFSSNNFKNLKVGFLNEMNEYRQLHGVQPLVKSSYLQQLAGFQVKRDAFPVPIMLKSNHSVGYISATYELKNANLIVKKIYDKFMSSYNWHGKNKKNRDAIYGRIIWNSTKEVGIGIYVAGSKLYAAFLFFPKGGFKDFKNNVFPISQKYLNMYNLYTIDRRE